MFREALVSRSCRTPQPEHTQLLTPRSFSPLGPLRVWHAEQTWELYRSSVSTNRAPCLRALYRSIERSALQPASRTDFAIFVRARAALFTSPTQIRALARTMRVLVSCRKWRRWAATFRWILRASFLRPARWARASLAAALRTWRGFLIVSPVESAARVVRPRSMPISPVPVGSSSTSSQTRLRYQRPVASWLKLPERMSVGTGRDSQSRYLRPRNLTVSPSTLRGRAHWNGIQPRDRF